MSVEQAQPSPLFSAQAWRSAQGQPRPSRESKRGADNRLWERLTSSLAELHKAPASMVELRRGQMLADGRHAMTCAYFPTSAGVSLLARTLAGKSCEVAMVGSEGMVGLQVVFGTPTALQQAVVTTPGHAWRVDAKSLTTAFAPGSAGRVHMLRYAHYLLTEVSQAAVCNLHHTVRQRLCRCLLAAGSRAPHTDLCMTQEAIGLRLGVRRESISSALRQLTQAGWVACSRGRVVVLDREGLERECCECHALLRREAERLQPGSSLSSTLSMS